MHRFRRVHATVVAVVAILLCLVPAGAQTDVVYNQLGFPLPPGVTLTVPDGYLTKVAFNTPATAVTLVNIATSLSHAQPGPRPALDCADSRSEDVVYDTLEPSPRAGTYVRIALGNTNPNQRVRLRVWSGAAGEDPTVRISTAGWLDQSAVLKWPGGDLHYSLQYCDNYAFASFPYETPNFSAQSQATDTAGSVRISSGDASALIEWGPPFQPAKLADSRVLLKVGVEKTCPQLQIPAARGYVSPNSNIGFVATNYAYANTVMDDGKDTPVVVASLKIEITYDPPDFVQTAVPPMTVYGQSSVATSEQMRSFTFGLNSPICRHFKADATAKTVAGRTITATVRTN